MKKAFSFSNVGVVASLGSLLLCCWFLWGNPYSESAASMDTILLLLVMLVAPAGLGLIGSLMSKGKLMFVALIWSLPYGLYMTVAKIPSLWNLFGVMLVLYLESGLGIRKREKQLQ